MSLQLTIASLLSGIANTVRYIILFLNDSFVVLCSLFLARVTKYDSAVDTGLFF